MAPAIEARGLSRLFGTRPAVEGLTFEVEEGEVFGLLGPNGAGKTTTVRMLCGLLTPSSGEVQVCGHDVRREPGAVRGSVGLLTEQPGLYDRLSAQANLLYFSRLYGVSDDDALPRIAHYLKLFGLWGREHEKVGGYSKGMRQKIAIVRALVHAPKVAFLDEPTSGLDPEASATVRAAISDLAREGRTIVLCTHNLDEAEKLCRRIAVVKGRILALGTVDELRGPRNIVELSLGPGPAGVAAALEALPFVTAVQSVASGLRITLSDVEAVPELVAKAVAAGARIREVKRVERALEQIYLDLVNPGAAEVVATAS